MRVFIFFFNSVLHPVQDRFMVRGDVMVELQTQNLEFLGMIPTGVSVVSLSKTH